MEALLLVVSSAAVLVGLGALVEAARPQRRGPGRSPGQLFSGMQTGLPQPWRSQQRREA
jgi:hypothetical protein